MTLEGRISALAGGRLGRIWPLIAGFIVLLIPTCLTMASQVWSREGSDAHGPIVILTGLWLLWRQFNDLNRDARPGNIVVIWILLAVSLAFYIFGRAYDFVYLEGGGLYAAALTLIYAEIGFAPMLRNWFPFVYLCFAVPPPHWLLDAVTAPLKRFVSGAATGSLQLFDIPVSHEGVTIFVAQYQLLVEDACSGMNSLIGLIAISLLYIYLAHGSSWRHSLVLMLFIVPIAVFANILRIMFLILLTYFFGDSVGQGFLHVSAGMALFAASLLIIFALDQVLTRAYQNLRGRMVGRREILIGAACMLGAGAAQVLRPHKTASLLGKRQLADILPATFGEWKSRDTTDLVAPYDDDSLASRLYEQTLSRIYENSGSGQSVMMLIAHGASQTNQLSFHRPELCYPAAGFTLSRSHTSEVPLGGGATLPVRCLLADAPNRRESVVYWSRMGEYLPTNSAEQRSDRMKTALQGYVPDGLLARFSALGANVDQTFDHLQNFIGEIVRATSPTLRAPLVGSLRTAALSKAGL